MYEIYSSSTQGFFYVICNIFCSKSYFLQHVFIYIKDILIMSSGNYQTMSFPQGMNIQKNKNILIFPDFDTWNLSSNYFTKYTVHSIYSSNKVKIYYFF